MNIEIITFSFLPLRGGIELNVEHLAEGLGKKGHKVCVHTANQVPGVNYKLTSYEEKENYIIKRYPSFPYSLFVPTLYFKNSVLSLHNYSCLANDYVSLMYPKRKKVLTPYGNISYKLSQRQHKYLATIYDKFIGKRTLGVVEKIIAMTPHEKNKIIKKYPEFKNKVLFIPAGIDFMKINPLTIGRSFPFKYFISVGRIAHTKRFEDVLYVMKDFPDYHYILAGRDIGHAEVLLKLALSLGLEKRFHYVGEVTEKEKIFLLRNGSIFIMPSSAEAFSIASLEAFYYSNRVIGAKSGGIVDLFKELGGEIYDFGNIDNLRESIRLELAKKLTDKVIRERKKIIEEKYSWDMIVKEYEKVLSE